MKKENKAVVVILISLLDIKLKRDEMPQSL